jgi:hypothetical protein
VFSLKEAGLITFAKRSLSSKWVFNRLKVFLSIVGRFASPHRGREIEMYEKASEDNVNIIHILLREVYLYNSYFVNNKGRLARTPVEALKLPEQGGDLELCHIHQPLVGDLELRDHGQGQKGEGHKGFFQRAPHLFDPSAQEGERIADLLD